MKWLLILVHNLAYLSINMYMISDWIVYGVLNIIFNLIYLLSDSKMDSYDFMSRNAVIIAVNMTVFALNEKVRKEMFIINLTNSKTKKQLMKIFN